VRRARHSVGEGAVLGAQILAHRGHCRQAETHVDHREHRLDAHEEGLRGEYDDPDLGGIAGHNQLPQSPGQLLHSGRPARFKEQLEALPVGFGQLAEREKDRDLVAAQQIKGDEKTDAVGDAHSESGALHLQPRQAEPAEDQGRAEGQIDAVDQNIDHHRVARIAGGTDDPHSDEIGDEQRSEEGQGAQIGHPGILGQSPFPLLDQFENVDRPGIPDQGEEEGHDDADHHRLAEDMIGLPEIARAQVTVHDDAGAHDEGQQQGEKDHDDLDRHTDTGKGFRAQPADENRLNRPHQSLGGEIDHRRQGGLEKSRYGGRLLQTRLSTFNRASTAPEARHPLPASQRGAAGSGSTEDVSRSIPIPDA